MERSYTTIDGNDILIWSLIGRVNADDVHRLYADQVAFCRGKPEIFVIVDLRAMQQMDAAARQVAAHGPDVDGKPMPVAGLAIVGGSFHMRLLAKMVNKAAALLTRVQTTPLEFFDTFDQARQWIATRRNATASTQ